VVLVLLVFLGLFAILPGWAMITDPTGAALGMSTDWLRNPLFPTYLIPGLFLFTVIGLGSVFVAVVLWVRPQWRWARAVNPFRGMEWAWSAALTLGIVVMLWILIQLLSVTLNSWLQPAIFVTGLAIVLLMLEPRQRRYFSLGKPQNDPQSSRQ
jgi:hypothetical protein